MLRQLSFSIMLLLLLISKAMHAQQVDSIFFHLYTDSLKKGTHNYINVDGKTHDGRWMPLTKEQLDFTCSAGRFEGNDLVLEKTLTVDSVVVTAGLKSSRNIKKTITIYVKKIEDNEKLKTKEEIMNQIGAPKRSKN